jgi:hypothetical protein
MKETLLDIEVRIVIRKCYIEVRTADIEVETAEKEELHI